MRRWAIPLLLVAVVGSQAGADFSPAQGIRGEMVAILDALGVTTGGTYAPATETLAATLAAGASANNVAVTGVNSLTGNTGGGAVAFVSTGTGITGPVSASSATVTSFTLNGCALHCTAMGEISYFSTTGTTVTIAAQSDGSTNLVTVAPVTALTMNMDFDNGGADDGGLRYTDTTAARNMHCGLSISYKHAGGGGADAFVVAICKNGAAIAASKVIGTTSSTSWESTALHVMTTLAEGDELTVKIGNLTDTDDVVVGTFNLFCMSSPEIE